MSLTDSSPCPFKAREGLRLGDLSASFFFWLSTERQDVVKRFPGLAEYIATRLGDTPGVKPPPPPKPRPSKPVQRPVEVPKKADLFTLAAAMRAAAAER